LQFLVVQASMAGKNWACDQGCQLVMSKKGQINP